MGKEFVSSMEDKTIQMNLFDYFMDSEGFSIQDAKKLVKEQRQINVNDESIRARIYEGVDAGIFRRVSRGVYKVESQIKDKKVSCLLINGNGRDLSFIEDDSIDSIITDHPYDLSKSLTGGNRKFATYELFKYQEQDFKEKNRVLKPGAFCVEFLPEENEVNYEYLYQVKQMAVEQGFKYFAKVPWLKGDFVANTGRKSKNAEDVMIFSKGEPRALKLNAKKNYAEAREHNLDISGLSSEQVKELLQQNNLRVHYMKGTSGMLPKAFDYQPRGLKEKVMEAEKPIELLEDIIEYVTLPFEVVLDQFAGSGNLAIASANKKRSSILIEKDGPMFERMKNHVDRSLISSSFKDGLYSEGEINKSANAINLDIEEPMSNKRLVVPSSELKERLIKIIEDNGLEYEVHWKDMLQVYSEYQEDYKDINDFVKSYFDEVGVEIGDTTVIDLIPDEESFDFDDFDAGSIGFKI